MENREQILRQLSELYVTYRQRYILCLPQGKIITPKTKNGNYCHLTDGVVRKHLEHAYAVGIFAGEWGSKFVCFDVDDGDQNTVKKIMDVLCALGIQRERIYVSYSGGKGYHVELFFEKIVSTEWLKRLYVHVVTEGGQDSKKVEFRPTNTTAIKLPLSIHAKTGNICWYVDKDTFERIESPEYILEIRQIPVADIEGLEIPSHIGQHELSADRKGGCASDETRNLGTMLIEQGTRHNMMRNIAVFERTHGKSREECEATLEQWLKQQDQSLIQSDETAVRCDMEELINWVYSDRFELNRPIARKKNELAASQLRWILEIKGRSNRRVLFLLLMRCILEHPSMSVKDMSKAVGISQPTIHKTIQRLLDTKRIEQRGGRCMKLPDGTYRCECSSYAVPFPSSGKNEQTLEITMRELIFDFDRCYHEAFDQLIPHFVLRQKLDRGEWQEYMQHLAAKRCAENQVKTPQRIDQVGRAHVLAHGEYGKMTIYELRGRFLYPACEVCKCLKLSYPSQRAGMCKHKEAWYVAAQSKSGAEAKAIRRNYIPAEDVKALVSCSKELEKEEICQWILSNETGGVR